LEIAVQMVGAWNRRH